MWIRRPATPSSGRRSRRAGSSRRSSPQQLEGTFDIRRTATTAERAGAHLTERQRAAWHKVVAAIEHKRRRHGRGRGRRRLPRATRPSRRSTGSSRSRCSRRGSWSRSASRGASSRWLRRVLRARARRAPSTGEAGYRLYLESLFDELSTEVKVLFDRRDPASVLWPRRQPFASSSTSSTRRALSRGLGRRRDDRLGLPVLQRRRRAQEDARREPGAARTAASWPSATSSSRRATSSSSSSTTRSAGRGSRCAAATHRWPTDCEYLVQPCRRRRSHQRSPKDPRDLKILDPACGSGHFLLYASTSSYDIYEEAWAAGEASPKRTHRPDPARRLPELSNLRRQRPA